MFVQHSVINLCLIFKFNCLSHFCSSNVHHQETLPLQSSSTHENCNSKFPLNIFSDQITIRKISYEIYTSFTSNKSFLCLDKKINIRIPFRYFPVWVSFFLLKCDVNKKTSIKKILYSYCRKEYYRVENMAEKIFLDTLLQIG